MDSSLSDTIRPGMVEWRKQDPPAEDEFSDGLQKLRKEGELSVWIVFASKVMLDIGDILGEDVGRGYKELRNEAVNTSKVLDFHDEGGIELVPGGAGECWHLKDSDLPMKVYETVEHWILKAPVPGCKVMFDPKELDLPSIEELEPEARAHIEREMRARGIHNDDVLPEHMATAKRLNLKPIKPSTDPDFIFTHNPLLCGTMMFNVALDMEKAGIALANHQLTIFAIAHLYNALQQANIIQGRWPELDKIIHMHIGQLFAGQLPTKPKDCRSQLSVRLGTSANAFARNRRVTKKPSKFLGSGMKHLPKFAFPDSSELLRDYSGRKEPVEQSLHRLESQIQMTDNARPSESKRISKRQLTSLQFLTQVRNWLPQVMTDTRFDYITMVRTCNKLLKRVRKRIHQRLGYLYPKIDEGFSNDHGQIFMIFSILDQAAEVQHIKGEVLRDRNAETPPTDLEVAGEVMQDFIDKHRASWIVSLD
ncbi:hypothetical protein MMC28_003974 [Mycoblastus sanguinarius]|nr:hypothetical protein [Mycoblastus sanguinarius]